MMAITMTEFVLEYLVFGFTWKVSSFIVLPAFLVVVFGQSIRTVAMYQAGQSFNHQVQETKAPTHKLVTTGLYKYCSLARLCVCVIF
jgi:protein-S-isoprenylcysteine O-methyltransferase